MQIAIIGKGYGVSDRLKKIIEQKTSKFDRYFDENVTVKVVCKEEGEKHTMEMTFNVNGQMIRAEVTSDNMYHNVDLALPKIEGQIRKYKTKLSKKLKHDAFSETSLYEHRESAVPKVVKQKVYDLFNMSVDDAIAELELLDQNFYIFINGKTGKVNVIYRRKDDDIGLIELEY